MGILCSSHNPRNTITKSECSSFPSGVIRRVSRSPGTRSSRPICSSFVCKATQDSRSASHGPEPNKRAKALLSISARILDLLMVGAPSGLFIGFRANRLPAHISLDIHIVALASADLDQDCRHRSAAAALDHDIIAVFLRRDAYGFWRGLVRYLKGFLE